MCFLNVNFGGVGTYEGLIPCSCLKVASALMVGDRMGSAESSFLCVLSGSTCGVSPPSFSHM